ncbi:MAG: peptidylprolyl isomerase, partial [Holophagales bacterium]|nr:peptidylprolyl isomerase [Holophagales bacterium]
MSRATSLDPTSLPYRARRGAPLVALACLLGGFLHLQPLPATAQGADPEPVNRIVLRVNDEILTSFQYERRKNGEINAILADPRLSPADRQERLAGVGKDVMQQLFREMLLESFASQRGVVASEREVDDALGMMMEQRGIESMGQLEEALASNNMTLDDLRRNIRQELVLSGVVRREVTAKIEVGEDELRAYYRTHPEEFQVPEERWLQEVIVLEESGLPAEELMRQAGKLRQELVEGGD